MADPDRTFTLVQPSARRREWQLQENGDVSAFLRIPGFRSGARAEIAGRPLRIERRGRMGAEILVTDEGSGEVVARLRRDGRRRLLEFGGRLAEWKRLDRKSGFGFVGQDGEPLVSGKVRSGLLRSSGELRSYGIDGREAVIAALLASYLLIRRGEQAASATGAVVVASS